MNNKTTLENLLNLLEELSNKEQGAPETQKEEIDFQELAKAFTESTIDGAINSLMLSLIQAWNEESQEEKDNLEELEILDALKEITERPQEVKDAIMNIAQTLQDTLDSEYPQDESENRCVCSDALDDLNDAFEQAQEYLHKITNNFIQGISEYSQDEYFKVTKLLTLKLKETLEVLEIAEYTRNINSLVQLKEDLLNLI